MRREYLISLLITLSLCLGVAGNSFADLFEFKTTLTGDPRAENPDNLVVDVTILGSTTSNVTYWLIDLNAPLDHPDMKLDKFYFNLALGTNTVSFDNFSPANWVVEAPGTIQGGGAGGATFNFSTIDPPGGGNTDVDITNFQSLSFDAMLDDNTDGTQNFWTLEMFTSAPLTELTAELGSAQMGAHLQSLTQVAGDGTTTDSGFATGNYDDGIIPQVPEPTTMLLFGTGLAGLTGLRRRMRSKN